MKTHLRIVVALFVIGLMVLSFAAVPVQAEAAAMDRQLTYLDREVPEASDFVEGLGYLDYFGPDSGYVNPVTVASVEPMEVILELEGRSLAAEQSYREERGWSALDGDSQKAYVASLKDSQAGLRTALEEMGATITFDYQIVFNGLAVVASPATLAEITNLAGVRGVRPVQAFSLALDKSVPFIFGGKTNAQLGADGSGVTIAVIDTGIDYTHADLGGSGLVADYLANNPTIIEPGTFPTAKVIGGTDLVGEWYSAGCPAVPPSPGVCSSIPVPDPDPLDLQGHGSHVSGIAAGVGIPTVSQGVAPAASLLAVKVFALGSTSSSVIAAALEFSADPNGDGDTSDAVDVVNMSLGGPYGRDTELGAVASNAAVDLGIIVVAAAANDGDLPYVHAAPAAASKAISVAAGNDPGIQVQLLTVAGSAGADGDYEALEAAFTPPLTVTLSGSTAFVGLACDVGAPGGPNPFPPGSLAGLIPLISRGACRFDEKIENVDQAGAIAAIVYNNQPGAGPITMGGNARNIPAFMIGNADGLSIRGALLPGTTFTLDPSKLMPIPDRLQGFTSRGPRFVDAALKPDITAPGGAIASVAVGTGTGAASSSGTSMSSPHIAGAAALMRQLHPGWSVEEIKALLMNTATDASPNGLPYPVSFMGAGRVRVDVAADTESVVVPASASFGVEERDRPGKQEFEVKLEVRNKGTMTKHFEISSAFIFPADDEGSIELKHLDEIHVKAGKSKMIKLKLIVDFDKLMPESDLEEYDGFLTLTETTAGGDALRVPFHMIPVARADGHAHDTKVNLPKDTTFTLHNKGLRGTNVDIYQFGVADPNEDLISEAPGLPADPDDWFDVRHTGAHAFDAEFSWGISRVLEFAVATHGLRSVANLMLSEVYIDVDEDGIPDYLVQAADLGLFIGGYPDGRMVSAVFALPFGAGFLEFLVADDMNTAIQTVPILLEDLNFLGSVFDLPTIDASDPDFNYFVATWDLETDSFDVTEWAHFNAIVPELDTDPNFFWLPEKTKVKVDVLASTSGGILVLYLNNEAGPNQSEVIDVRA